MLEWNIKTFKAPFSFPHIPHPTTTIISKPTQNTTHQGILNASKNFYFVSQTQQAHRPPPNYHLLRSRPQPTMPFRTTLSILILVLSILLTANLALALPVPQFGAIGSIGWYMNPANALSPLSPLNPMNYDYGYGGVTSAAGRLGFPSTEMVVLVMGVGVAVMGML
jgi:hypothetical protein